MPRSSCSPTTTCRSGPDWLGVGGSAAAERTGHRLHRRTRPADLGRAAARVAESEKGNLGGTIAVKDHGRDRSSSRTSCKTPLGVNMAVRRSLIETIGGFRPDLGRNGKALLGQEQAEFFYRSRAAGARGLYVPAMVLDHVVPRRGSPAATSAAGGTGKACRTRASTSMHGRTELEHRRPPRPARARRAALRLRQRRSGTCKGWLRGWMRRDPAKRASTGCRSPTTPDTAARSGGRRRVGSQAAEQANSRRSSVGAAGCPVSRYVL